MTGMLENVRINVKNKSKTIPAEVEVPAGGANGTILAQGGRFGGWSLHVRDGRPAFDYNVLGMQRYTIAAPQPFSAGKHTIQFDFAHDGGGLDEGGAGTLFVDGQKVAEGRIERTPPMIFSVDGTADVSIDLGTPVVERIGAERRSRFTGRILKPTVEIRDADAKADAAVRETLREVARRTEGAEGESRSTWRRRRERRWLRSWQTGRT